MSRRNQNLIAGTIVFAVVLTAGDGLRAIAQAANTDGMPDQSVIEQRSTPYSDQDALQNPKMELYARHRTLARYHGTRFSMTRIWGQPHPAACGEFARFTIVKYLSYRRVHKKYGEKQRAEFSIRVTDMQRRPVGEEQLRKIVHSLSPGDLVYLAWDHMYGEMRPRTFGCARPVFDLRKVKDAAEAEPEIR